MSERPEEVRLLEPLLPQLKPFEEVPAVTDQHFTLEELETEEWRPVVDFEGLYEVSNVGRVRSVRAPGSRRTGRVLRPAYKHGYVGVSLCRGKEIEQRVVHILVAAAFIGPCPNGLEVGHEDNDRANNRLSNLSYVTHAQNMRHCAKTVGHVVGERNFFATTTEAQAVRVKQLLQVGGTGMPPGVIAVCVGVSIHVVYQIQSGKNWTHCTMTS